MRTSDLKASLARVHTKDAFLRADPTDPHVVKEKYEGMRRYCEAKGIPMIDLPLAPVDLRVDCAGLPVMSGDQPTKSACSRDSGA